MEIIEYEVNLVNINIEFFQMQALKKSRNYFFFNLSTLEDSWTPYADILVLLHTFHEFTRIPILHRIL